MLKSQVRQWPILLLGAVGGALVATSVGLAQAGGSARGDAGSVRVDMLLRAAATTSGQSISMPQGPVEVAFSRYRIPARASLPVHKHLYPRYGYVLDGSLSVTNATTNRTRVFGKGEAIVEDVGTWHSARDLAGEPVGLLVVDVLKSGAANVVVR